MSRRGPAEGVVRIGQGRHAGEVLVSGRKALNRAIHGDIVAGNSPSLMNKLRRWSVAGIFVGEVCGIFIYKKMNVILSQLYALCYSVQLLPKNQWPASTAAVLEEASAGDLDGRRLLQEASAGDLDEDNAPDGLVDGQDLAGTDLLPQVFLSPKCYVVGRKFCASPIQAISLVLEVNQ